MWKVARPSRGRSTGMQRIGCALALCALALAGCSEGGAAAPDEGEVQVTPPAPTPSTTAPGGGDTTAPGAGQPGTDTPAGGSEPPPPVVPMDGTAGTSATPEPPVVEPPPTSGPFPPVASFGDAGPFATVQEQVATPDPGFVLIRPVFADDGLLHPVITWGNGTGATPGSYGPLLDLFATHGFIVIASNSTNVGSGEEMRQGVDHVFAENDNPASPLFGKVDTTRVGATGHSQGGFGTLQAGADPRISTTAPIEGASGFGITLHGPTFLTAGGMDEIVAASGVESAYNAINGVPAMFGLAVNATHFTPSFTGGTFRAPLVAWFRWQLMDDQTASQMFLGQDCGLCTDPEWQLQSKGF